MMRDFINSLSPLIGFLSQLFKQSWEKYSLYTSTGTRQKEPRNLISLPARRGGLLWAHKTGLVMSVIAGVLLLLTGCQTQHVFAGLELSAPHPAPDIALESAEGPVSLHDFRDQYTYVYFGYTFCPDVCPTTLAVLARVRAELKTDADQMQVVMITVDPERDTPERLAEYMGYFDKSFVGLSADNEILDRVGEPFGLYYRKGVGSEATGYLIAHTSRVYLLDRQSNAIVAYSHGTSADDFLKDLKYLIASD
jgi:protein SCO1/2